MRAVAALMLVCNHAVLLKITAPGLQEGKDTLQVEGHDKPLLNH